MAACVCKNCGHEWESRVPKPKACPMCKHYNWDKSRWDTEKGVENEVAESSPEE